MAFSEKILEWYMVNKRSLPWRETKEPYNIWLSEIILQQTRVAQGLPYYEKFVKVYPTVFDLAKAPEQEVLKLWQGLGYYSRARNMHHTAKWIVEELQGVFPKTRKELLKLKGVGDYTASAIASICFGEKVPVVDGNVYRVLSRYFGIDLPINEPKGINYFKELAVEIMNQDHIADYNQAIMEFGAMQCTPKKPLCTTCELNKNCQALKEDRVFQLPVKLKKTKIRKRHFNYLVPITENRKTTLEQRVGKGIWQGLYQFPMVETETEIDLAEFVTLIPKNYNEVKSVELFNSKPIVHKLSHQHLYTKFWILEACSIKGKKLTYEALRDYPVPVLISDFIETFKF